jgi:site-specific recombinase XerD
MVCFVRLWAEAVNVEKTDAQDALGRVGGGKRDRALLALLLACGLRRHEAVSLRLEHLEQREEHWAIVDLKGKAGHVRTFPFPRG